MDTPFKNSTVFFVPFKIPEVKRKNNEDTLGFFCAKIDADKRWKAIDVNELNSPYLMPYVTRIVTSSYIKNKNGGQMLSYRLKDLSLCDNLHMFERLRIGGQFQDKTTMSDEITAKIKLVDVRLTVFGTGIGFLEWWVEYGDSPLEVIEDFAYYFKKARPKAVTVMPDKVSLYDKCCEITSGLLNNGDVFFSKPRSDDPNEDIDYWFKYECHTFHMIMLPERQYSDEYIAKHLALLKRSYNNRFDMSDMSKDNDMIYAPYVNNYWAGSQESIVNLVYENKDVPWSYLEKRHYGALKTGFHLMYLNLLNQRYTSIEYVSNISESKNLTRAELELMNENIVHLKTIYSSSVVSDDLIYQNVYSQMFDIFNIDGYMSDIHDNEEQMSMIKTFSSEKTEKTISIILSVISFLTLFSILIDTTSFLDQFVENIVISIVSITIVSVGLVLVIGLILWDRKR